MRASSSASSAARSGCRRLGCRHLAQCLARASLLADLLRLTLIAFDPTSIIGIFLLVMGHRVPPRHTSRGPSRTDQPCGLASLRIALRRRAPEASGAWRGVRTSGCGQPRDVIRKVLSTPLWSLGHTQDGSKNTSRPDSSTRWLRTIDDEGPTITESLRWIRRSGK